MSRPSPLPRSLAIPVTATWVSVRAQSLSLEPGLQPGHWLGAGLDHPLGCPFVGFGADPTRGIGDDVDLVAFFERRDRGSHLCSVLFHSLVAFHLLSRGGAALPQPRGIRRSMGTALLTKCSTRGMSATIDSRTLSLSRQSVAIYCADLAQFTGRHVVIMVMIIRGLTNFA